MGFAFVCRRNTIVVWTGCCRGILSGGCRPTTFGRFSERLAIHFSNWQALIPSALLHLAVAFRFRKLAALAYVVAPFAWWSLSAELGVIYTALLVTCLALSVADLLMRAAVSEPVERRFRRAMAGAMGLSLAAAAAGPDSAWIVVGGVAPSFCLFYFIARFNILGLFISRRIVFAAVLGGVSAVYLLLARRASDWAQQEFEVFGPAIEVMLILAAVSVWVPLYAWMNRVLSKRTQVFADFGKSLIQEAAAIFDFEQRLEYVARELGTTFKLRRVLLVAAEESAPRVALFGTPAHGSPMKLDVAALTDSVREKKLDAVAGPRSERELIDGTGFNYLFPLWYEDRLAGLLLVDTSPRSYLDEDEAILWGLSRQISHAIESCRLLERKISLEKALARSEHMASLGLMAATIAHEVKNPLSSIKSLAQLMQEDEELSDGYRRDLSYIVAEINRLNSCVEQLLTFSRPVPEGRAEIAVQELLANISSVLNREYAEQRVQFEYHSPARMTLKNIDPQSLHQIVLNLAINAAQASPPGGVVEINAFLGEKSNVVITVADHGAGVPAEIRNKIFDPFFTTKQKGSGLGLAIVAKNVRHLGGEVRLEDRSNGERGTAITVTLPVEVA